jgi:hypothetical protein
LSEEVQTFLFFFKAKQNDEKRETLDKEKKKSSLNKQQELARNKIQCMNFLTLKITIVIRQVLGTRLSPHYFALGTAHLTLAEKKNYSLLQIIFYIV